jgi:hypothetical protein
MICVYPQNYEKPVEPAEETLTSTERAQLKTRMQTRINNLNAPVPVKELVDDCHEWLAFTFNRHIHWRQIMEIAMEIRSEWGVPDGVE